MIDIHAHIFPDGIAAATVAKLAEEAGIAACSDGSLAGLTAQMKAQGVRRAFNQPVATRPEQVRGINRKMIELAQKGLPVTSFGAMHPDYDGAAGEVRYLQENGIRGIKLHPEYQGFYPDDDRLLPLYEACVANKMSILFHAGFDLAFSHVHGTPERFRRVAGIRGLTVILAHMGGYRMWDAVERELVGTGAFFDTSFCLEMDDGLLRSLILGHGPEKVLFGTDSPWENAAHTRDKVRGLGLGKDIEEKIFFRNSAALFLDNFNHY